MELISTFRTKTTEIECRGTEIVKHSVKRFSVSVIDGTEIVNCPKCDKVFKVSDFIGIH